MDITAQRAAQRGPPADELTIAAKSTQQRREGDPHVGGTGAPSGRWPSASRQLRAAICARHSNAPACFPAGSS